jgi:hypothetical protein
VIFSSLVSNNPHPLFFSFIMRYRSTRPGNYTFSLAFLVAPRSNRLSVSLHGQHAAVSRHAHSLTPTFTPAATPVIKPPPPLAPTHPSERDNGKKIICKTKKTSSFIRIALHSLCSTQIRRRSNNDARQTKHRLASHS